jgi:hypothetical protein
MTNNASYTKDQNFDSEDGFDDELEVSAGKQILNAVAGTAQMLRRTKVFVPIFGVVFLAIGFLWFQSVQAERSLNAQSVNLRSLLEQPAPQPDQLLLQADGWDTAYQAVLSQRTARPTDSDLLGHAIFAAREAGLVVLETGTTDDGEVTLENEQYVVTPLLLKANGTLRGIESFLAILETPEFSAFEVQASLVNAEEVGYLLTLKGIFYSLPETFGDSLLGDSGEVAVIPIAAVGGDTTLTKLEVAP